jgi:GTP cyclohydrolase II
VDPEADFSRKMEAYDLSDAGMDKAPARKRPKPGKAGPEAGNGGHHGSFMDARTYGIGAQILYDLGVRNLHLLTNHPKRIQGLEGYGLKITRQSPLEGTARLAEKARMAPGPGAGAHGQAAEAGMAKKEKKRR